MTVGPPPPAPSANALPLNKIIIVNGMHATGEVVLRMHVVIMPLLSLTRGSLACRRRRIVTIGVRLRNTLPTPGAYLKLDGTAHGGAKTSGGSMCQEPLMTRPLF